MNFNQFNWFSHPMTFAHVICVTLLSPSLLISHHPSGFHLIVLVIEWKWSGCESSIIQDTTNSQTASSWMLLLFNQPWSEIPFHLTMQAINLTRTEGQWHINMEMAVGQHWLIPIVIEVTNQKLISSHSLYWWHYFVTFPSFNCRVVPERIEWCTSTDFSVSLVNKVFTVHSKTVSRFWHVNIGQRQGSSCVEIKK